MALNIKDPDTDRLARELAAATGESITVATRQAIEERLARRPGPFADRTPDRRAPRPASPAVTREADARPARRRHDPRLRRRRTAGVTIAVDTSALVAIVLGEPDAEAYLSVLSSNSGDIEMCAATYVEASIVVTARQGSEADDDLTKLLSLVEIDVTPVDHAQSRAAIAAWRRFGKGHHPAALNFGDCFSYTLAKTSGTALLYKGDDFAQTDVAVRALIAHRPDAAVGPAIAGRAPPFGSVGP